MALTSTIGLFYRKKWAWLFVISYLFYLIAIILEGLLRVGIEFGIDWIMIDLVSVLLLGVTIFFMSKKVRNYFELSTKYIFGAATLFVLILLMKEIDPIKETDRLNMYYLELSEEEKWYFDDSLYT
ncbi:MAG: hypothetical protein AAF599_05730, partial [Bacteroidota bacterium]